ncbi:MAG TPA: HypC/HybG/HupF family hydrogenase formation chaperone [Actinomadura sp.]|jgi:hydrogenase maturation factor|nr:HypC/HybG/HupF family hydrogenase formation chaperone [Actinomadura sp.]
MTEHERSSRAVCVTCADEALPMTVVRLLGRDQAVAESDGGQERISVTLVDAAVGDTVLVHAQEALAVVDGDEHDSAEHADVPGPATG